MPSTLSSTDRQVGTGLSYGSVVAKPMSEVLKESKSIAPPPPPAKLAVLTSRSRVRVPITSPAPTTTGTTTVEPELLTTAPKTEQEKKISSGSKWADSESEDDSPPSPHLSTKITAELSEKRDVRGREATRDGWDNRRPDSRDRRPDSRDRRPDSRDRRPDSRDRRPDSRDRRPDSRDRRLDSRGRRPDSRGRRPDSRDRRAWGGATGFRNRKDSRERVWGNGRGDGNYNMSDFGYGRGPRTPSPPWERAHKPRPSKPTPTARPSGATPKSDGQWTNGIRPPGSKFNPSAAMSKANPPSTGASNRVTAILSRDSDSRGHGTNLPLKHSGIDKRSGTVSVVQKAPEPEPLFIPPTYAELSAKAAAVAREGVVEDVDDFDIPDLPLGGLGGPVNRFGPATFPTSRPKKETIPTKSSKTVPSEKTTDLEKTSTTTAPTSQLSISPSIDDAFTAVPNQASPRMATIAAAVAAQGVNVNASNGTEIAMQYLNSSPRSSTQRSVNSLASPSNTSHRRVILTEKNDASTSDLAKSGFGRAQKVSDTRNASSEATHDNEKTTDELALLKHKEEKLEAKRAAINAKKEAKKAAINAKKEAKKAAINAKKEAKKATNVIAVEKSNSTLDTEAVSATSLENVPSESERVSTVSEKTSTVLEVVNNPSVKDKHAKSIAKKEKKAARIAAEKATVHNNSADVPIIPTEPIYNEKPPSKSLGKKSKKNPITPASTMVVDVNSMPIDTPASIDMPISSNQITGKNLKKQKSVAHVPSSVSEDVLPVNRKGTKKLHASAKIPVNATEESPVVTDTALTSKKFKKNKKTPVESTVLNTPDATVAIESISHGKQSKRSSKKIRDVVTDSTVVSNSPSGSIGNAPVIDGEVPEGSRNLSIKKKRVFNKNKRTDSSASTTGLSE